MADKEIFCENNLGIIFAQFFILFIILFLQYFLFHISLQEKIGRSSENNKIKSQYSFHESILLGNSCTI